MTSCIHTTYETSAGGYGRLRHQGKKVLHHRLVYCLANKVPLESIAGLHVLHTCDTPSCINPEHLVLGSHADNMADSARKGRKRGEKAWRAVLTEAQVLEIRALQPYKLPSTLAALYGVSESTIRDILTRRNWSYL